MAYNFLATPEENKKKVTPSVPFYQSQVQSPTPIIKSTPVITPKPVTNLTPEQSKTLSQFTDYNAITGRNIPTTNYSGLNNSVVKPKTNIGGGTGTTNNNQDLGYTKNGEIDYIKLAEAISKKMAENTPKVDAYKPYQSPLNDQKINTLNQIQNYKEFQFDPNDPGLKQLQDQATQKVRQDMAKRGRLYDTYAQIKEQEASQGLIPFYYNAQQNQYNADRSNMYNTLNAIQGIDQTNYNRYNQTYDTNKQNTLNQQNTYANSLNYGNQQAEQQRQIANEEEVKIQKQEMADFGTTLSPQARDLRQSYLQIPVETRTKLETLSNQAGGYATTINKLVQSDPNNAIIPQLQAMRLNKILSDPELMAQYGGDYGMQSGAVNQMAVEQRQKQLLNNLEVLKQQVSTQKDVATISQIQAEIQKINAETKYKDVQIIAERYVALQEQIKASSLPYELQAKIQTEIAKERELLATAYKEEQAGNKYKTAQALDMANVGLAGAKTTDAYASANANNERANTEKTKQVENIENAKFISSKKYTEDSTRQGKVDKLQSDINKAGSSNEIKKLIDSSFAVTEYKTTTTGGYSGIGGTTKETATGRKILPDADKDRVANLLVDKYLQIQNPTTTDKKRVTDIEDVSATYGLDKLFTDKLKKALAKK